MISLSDSRIYYNYFRPQSIMNPLLFCDSTINSLWIHQIHILNSSMHFESATFFANWLWIQWLLHALIVNLYVSRIDCKVTVSRIDYELTVYEFVNSVWNHYSRQIHEFTIFFINPPWIHYHFVNTLWIFYQFCELTINPLSA